MKVGDFVTNGHYCNQKGFCSASLHPHEGDVGEIVKIDSEHVDIKYQEPYEYIWHINKTHLMSP